MRAAVPLVALVLLVTVFSPPSSGSGAPEQPDPQPAAVVEVTTTDYSFHAPDTVPAGSVEFRLTNRGPDLHHIWIVRLEKGRKAGDILSQFQEGKHLPEWAQELGGPNVPPPGAPAIATVHLAPGRYALLCLIPGRDKVRHIKKGMMKELTATGPARAPDLPRADITMTLTDHDFALSSPLRAGRQVIAVRNDAEQSHMVALLKLQPGKTAADYVAWTQDRKGPPPARPHGGISGIDKGVVNTLHLELEPGDYALICFVPDLTDGRPHFAHGMMKQVRVL